MTDQINSDAPQFEWQNPKPQFDVGRVLGRTFSAIKNNLVKFGLLCFVVVGIPLFLVGLWPLFIYGGEGMMSGGEMSDNVIAGTVIGSLIGVIVYILSYCVVSAILTHACFKDFAGEEVSLKRSGRTALALFLPLIGVLFLYFLGLMIGFMLLIIPGIFLLLGWYLVIPVLLVEKTGVLETLSRSWELTKGYKRWILLVTIILTIISFVFSIVITLVSVPFGDPNTAALTGASVAFWVVNSFVSALAQCFAVMINSAAVAAMYFEIRDLKEGITPESIASVFD
ncbi:hypothetical protein [Litorimonas haliclonae]|uniref:hypothetical protein n=1 Tax=Litorimonas haliclonae TaxID=2081977 RepID=UPI0039EFCF2F